MRVSSIEQLADFAAGLSLGDIPADVRERARACLLDGIGCILGAWALPQGEWIARWAESMGGEGEAAIPGGNRLVPLVVASYASGCLINMLDFDDTAPLAGHPGAGVIPAVLATAWWHLKGRPFESCIGGIPVGVSGGELIPAVVAGYEVSIRVVAAGKPSAEREARVRGHSTWQTFGAAAAAGRMLGLDSRRMAQALALASLHAPVPFVGRWYDRPINTVKNNYGWVAMGGVLSAILAREGWTGNVGILDGPGGFWEMAGSDRWNPNLISEALGISFRIMDVGFKRYPACWHMGAALSALDRIVQSHSVTVGAVAKVRIRSAPYITNFADWDPRSPFDAQFSLPYASAMVLLRIPPGPRWFDPELLFSSEVREVMSKVEIVGEEIPSGAPGRIPARVTVETFGRARWSEEALWPPGDPLQPPSWEEIVRKFRHLAQTRLDPCTSEEIVSWVRSLGE